MTRDSKTDKERLARIEATQEFMATGIDKINHTLDVLNRKIDDLQEYKSRAEGSIGTFKWVASLGGLSGVAALLKAMLHG